MLNRSLRADDWTAEALEKYAEMVYRLAFAQTRNRQDAAGVVDVAPDDDQSVPQENGEIWRYAGYSDLPEEIRNQDKLNVRFGINQRATVVRADSEGVWTAGQRFDKAEFAFEVENNGQETRFAYGAFENEVYSVRAELRLSEIGCRVMMDMTRPQEWAGANEETDYIRDYHVMYPDGTHEGVMESSEPTDNNGYRMEGTISLQEGQTEVVLRPYYALTGLREGEDIILEIPSVK